MYYHRVQSLFDKLRPLTQIVGTIQMNVCYRESPHKTVKWETENTVLCEIVLFQIENRDIAKNSTM